MSVISDPGARGTLKRIRLTPPRAEPKTIMTLPSSHCLTCTAQASDDSLAKDSDVFVVKRKHSDLQCCYSAVMGKVCQALLVSIENTFLRRN